MHIMHAGHIHLVPGFLGGDRKTQEEQQRENRGWITHRSSSSEIEGDLRRDLAEKNVIRSAEENCTARLVQAHVR